MAFYILPLKSYFKNGKKKEKEDDATFLRKKNRRKTKHWDHTSRWKVTRGIA